MNIRKPIDYSAMYSTLDQLIVAGLPQAELYFEIGRAIRSRPGNGAAVIAAEFRRGNKPASRGFSPGTCAGCGSFTVPTLIVRSCGTWP